MDRIDVCFCVFDNWSDKLLQHFSCLVTSKTRALSFRESCHPPSHFNLKMPSLINLKDGGQTNSPETIAYHTTHRTVAVQFDWFLIRPAYTSTRHEFSFLLVLLSWFSNPHSKDTRGTLWNTPIIQTMMLCSCFSSIWLIFLTLHLLRLTNWSDLESSFLTHSPLHRRILSFLNENKESFSKWFVNFINLSHFVSHNVLFTTIWTNEKWKKKITQKIGKLSKKMKETTKTWRL